MTQETFLCICILQVLESRQCWKYNALGELNWTLILNNTENSCVFIFLQPLYPGAVIAWTGSHILSDIFLSIGAMYRSQNISAWYCLSDIIFLLHWVECVLFAKLWLNSQLDLHFNSIQSPLQVNSTPPRVELELYPIFDFHHPPTSPHYFSELQNQVN